MGSSSRHKNPKGKKKESILAEKSQKAKTVVQQHKSWYSGKQISFSKKTECFIEINR